MSTQADLKSRSTGTLLIGVWGYLTSKRRLQLCLLLVVMVASGLAEVASIGAVLPFLVLLSDPVRLWREPVVRNISNWLGFTTPEQLILPATILFAFAAVIASLVRLLNLWLNGKLAASVGSDLSCEAYRRTLYQPYEVHIKRSSAEVITSTTTQISFVVVAINNFLQLITSAVVACSLLVALLIADSLVALSAAILFGGTYSLIAVAARRELRSNGQKIADASRRQLTALQEGLNSIRDVLLDGSQSYYLQIYQAADRPQRQLQAKNTFFGAFPRYALEAIGMVAIALLGGSLVIQRGSAASAIPLLGTFALGAQRLLPATQQIYRCWSALNGYNAALEDVLKLLHQQLPSTFKRTSNSFILREGIKLSGVHFRYGSEYNYILKGLDLEIRTGERIGIVGSTGSGKSTLIDIMMGLLKPTSGKFFVDGYDINAPENLDQLASWQSVISHVPQSIYLADSSFAENIALGVPRSQIDLNRVKESAAQAQIASLIESSPDGYDTFVGERGINLSGGQCQRIGIARALYKRARILFCDEATSALDTGTEEAVMTAFEGLSEELTIVLITHRPNTLKWCDRVICINDGIASEPDL